MDNSDLDILESSVQDLLSLVRREVEEKRIQTQRDQYVSAMVAEIEQRLKPLLEEVENTLKQISPDDISDSTRQKLEEKAADLRQKLDGAPALAQRMADQQMILNEERLLDERQARQLEEWRYQLKADLLEMIADQQDFYSATDAAVSIRSHVQDLKEIGALEEVVEALMAQINAYNNSEREGPVAKLRGTYEQTLNFIYEKAMANRSRVERPPNVQPRTRHRTSEKQPNPYAQLEGKVVVFGGHDRLETAVRNRLRDSNVQLVWCSAQSGLQIAEQGENHIYNADMVIVITGYASHALTEKAMQAAEKAGITPEMINTTGMTRVLETIEYGLKTRLLQRRMNCSKQ
jgi:hypothetical protein